MQLYNIFDKTAKQIEAKKSEARTTAKAVELLRDKPFLERHSKTVKAVIVLVNIGNSASILTTFIVATKIFNDSLGMLGEYSIGVAAIFGFVFAGALEGCKNVLLSASFVNWLKYRTLGIAAGMAIAAQIASVAISFAGATMLPKITATTLPFDESAYDKRATEIADEIKAIRSSNQWKGNTTRKGNELISEAYKRAEQVDKDRTAARAAYNETQAATISEQGETENLLGYVSLANEAMILLCSFFYTYYLYRVYIEDGGEAHTNQATPIQTASESLTPTEAPAESLAPAPTEATNRRQIGFNNNNTDFEILIPSHSNPHLRECEHCSKQFQYNHKKQRFCSDACRLENYKMKKGSSPTR